MQGFFRRLHAGRRQPDAWERGRPVRMRARGPRSQEPLQAGRVSLIRGLGLSAGVALLRPVALALALRGFAF